MPTSSKKFRWAWGAAVLLSVLAAAGFLAQKFLMDEARWIGVLEQRATAATGRTVKIGHLAFHLLPLPGIDAKQVSVANPAWAQQPQLLQITELSAQLALRPLLHGQVQLVSLSLQGGRLDGETDFHGAHSWTLTQFAASRTISGNSGIDPSHFVALELRDIEVYYRSGHDQSDSALRKWHIEHLSVKAKPGLRDLQLDGLIRHGSREMVGNARLDGLGALANGRAELHIGSARVTLEGRLPLQPALTNSAFALQAEAQRPNDLLEFFDITSRTIAPFSLRAEIHEAGGKLLATGIDATLAKLHVTGAAQFDSRTARPTVDAQLAMPRLDWVQTLADVGRPPLPPKPRGELFRTHQLAWWALAALHGWQGTVDLQIGALKTRPGIELTDATARLYFEDDHLHVNPMHADMLDGTAQGSVHLIAKNKSVHLNLELHDVSLQKWITATGKTAPLRGGPMQVTASVDATGGSIKELAASLTGPVSIRLGPTVITSEPGARAEELLTGLMPIFSAPKSNQILLECGGANLPFVAGRASAAPLVGVRSQSSQLLSNGFLDLREETLDLRGRVRARSGFRIGLATLAGDIKITGLVAHPRASLDPTGTPAALARLGAAVVTGGLSIVCTALWNGANPGADPCHAVFAKNTANGRRTEKVVR